MPVRVVLLAAIATSALACHALKPGSSSNPTMIVDGVEYPAQADIRIIDEAPLYDYPPTTELNVTAWYAESLETADDREAIALRLFNEIDFRTAMRSGESIRGRIMDQRVREDGKPPTSLALELRIEQGNAIQLDSTGGEFEVSFARAGRVRGWFNAHLTHEDGSVPPHDVEVEFDLEAHVLCFQNPSDTGDDRQLDPEFSSEFCEPFREWKRDG